MSVRFRLLVLSTAIAVLTVFPIAARADVAPTSTPVKASGAQVAQYLFVAGDVDRLSMIPSGTESLVLEKVLQQLYAANPGLDPNQAASDIQGLQASLHSISPDTLTVMAGNQRILAILRALSDSKPPPDVRQALSQVVDHALNDASQSTQPLGQKFDPSADSLSTIGYYTFSPAQTLAATASLAAGNQSFGRARDLLWKQASHESVFDDAQTLQAENPALQNDAIRGFMALVSSDGTLSTTAGTLEGLIKAGVTQIGDQTCTPAPGTAGTSPSDCAAGALHDAQLVSQKCASGSTPDCTDARNQAQNNAGPEIDTIRRQRSATAAEAVALGDVDTALEQAEIAEGQAASQVAYDENQYLEYATTRQIELTTLDVAKYGLSLLGDEVDPLEAISGLLDVIGDTTGYGFADPTTAILQGIQDVSRQIAAFEKYTSIAFESLDNQIGALSQQLGTEFQTLSAQLTGIQTTLTSLGSQLSNLQGSVDRLDADVQALFAQGAKNALVQDVNTYLGYGQSSHGSHLDYTTFNTAAESFLTNATTIATSITELTPISASDFSAEGANRILSGTDGGTLDSNINLFNYFPGNVSDSPSGLGWPDASQNLSSGCASAGTPSKFLCLPNPSYWALAAQAYAQLLMENPQFYDSTRQAELQRILNDGNAIATAIARLSANDAGQDGGFPPGTGNKLLDSAIAYYRYWGGAADHAPGTTPSLPQVLRAEERSYLTSQNANGVDPWGGVKQSPDVSTLSKSGSFTKIPLCTAFVQTLGGNIDPNKFLLPELTTQMIAFLPVQVQNAVRLGVGHVQACWQAAFSGWSPGSGGTVNGTLSMEVSYNYVTNDGTLNETVGFSQGNVHTSDCTGSAGTAPGETQFYDDLLGINNVIDNWPGVSAANGNCVDMSLVLGNATNEHAFYPSDVATAVEPALKGRLAALQTGVYSDTLSALDTGNGAVQAAAQRYGGAAALLNGYVSLGLPQSLATDDTLRGLIDGTAANPFTPTNLGGGLPLQVPAAPEGVTLLKNVYQAAEAQMPGEDPINTLGFVVDNRALNLQYALRADIVPGAAQSLARAGAAGRAAAATSTSPALAQDNALISPTLDRLANEQAALGDATSNGVPLRVSLAGQGSGTVSGSGISCPAACSGTFTPGTAVTLTATPASGWAFTGWSGACSGTGPCTVTMGLYDTGVTATFGPAQSTGPQYPGAQGSGGQGSGGQGTGSQGAAPNPVGHHPAPRCTLKVAGTKVLLASRRGQRASQPKPGTVSVIISCDQSSGVALGGRVTRVVGPKPKHGKQRSITSQLATVRRNVTAGAKVALTLNLPAGAVTALGSGAQETVAFSLTATNANGTTRVAATAGPLHGMR